MVVNIIIIIHVTSIGVDHTT